VNGKIAVIASTGGAMNPANVFRRLPRPVLAMALIAVMAIVLASCGGDDDDADSVATTPEPSPTEAAQPTSEPEPTATPEPVVSDDSASDDVEPVDPDPTPTEEPAEPTPTPQPEPAEDIDFAPELAGLTDWRNTDPLTLEELRGEPVVLVFWNSI
jgi:outer membrane biosynthesis protein TonB